MMEFTGPTQVLWGFFLPCTINELRTDLLAKTVEKNPHLHKDYHYYILKIRPGKSYGIFSISG